MKQLYELLTYPLSVIDNPLWDFIFITALGSISFLIAWNFVGETGIRGKAGSILHWTVRLIVMFALCSITSLFIKTIRFIIQIPTEVWVMIIIILILLIIIAIIVKFTFFNKKEKQSLLLIKRKNRYVILMTKIVNNYYLKQNFILSKDDIINNNEDELIYSQIEDMLIIEKLIQIDKQKNKIIDFRTIMFLEKYIKEIMNYTIGALAFMVTVITFIISILSYYNNPYIGLISIVLFIEMLGFIFKYLPNDKS